MEIRVKPRIPGLTVGDRLEKDSAEGETIYRKHNDLEPRESQLLENAERLRERPCRWRKFQQFLGLFRERRREEPVDTIGLRAQKKFPAFKRSLLLEESLFGTCNHGVRRGPYQVYPPILW
ncbi:MAG: hypothetical protein DMD91_31610 [Candidatus Rokuibacteriota bacterium]|nr:MAG: hypothetical protein DMD91_31610 [Candidatus Rokubacteria bacterium]